jgi:hypothetical protein
MSNRRKAFVLMPFHAPVNSYYLTIFKPALEVSGYSVTRADDLFVPRPIMLDIQASILESDLVLCEMSGRNPNVFYELGLAHAIGKPAILVSCNEQDIPFDLRYIRAILYDCMQAGWEEKLQEDIKAAAQAIAVSTEIWPKPLTATNPKSSIAYGIKISSPAKGQLRSGRFEVTGSFEAIPGDGSVQLFISSPDDNEYWPQGAVKFDHTRKTWSGYVALYEKPPREANIVVAKVGESGRILCDHYTRVGHETDKYPPLLRLTEDIVECDRVRVFKVRP